MQYFERARMEFHPENPEPYQVILTDVGRTAYARYLRDLEYPRSLIYYTLQGECVYFEVTSRNVCGVFLEYWRGNGLNFGDPGVSFRESLALFGYPLSITDREDGTIVQYFERAVFVLSPDGAVELRNVGVEYLEDANTQRQLWR